MHIIQFRWRSDTSDAKPVRRTYTPTEFIQVAELLRHLRINGYAQGTEPTGTTYTHYFEE